MTALPVAASAPRGRRPSARSGPPLAFRHFQGLLTNYRRTWRGSAISSVLAPLLFLTAMGISLGKLVDHGPGATAFGQSQGNQVTYLLFIAPALLVSGAMQTAIGESTYPVQSGLKWQRTYHAAVASPLLSRDVFLGHLAFVLLRVAMNGLVFLGIMAAFGAVRATGPLGLGPLFAVGAALLTGLAFAAPVAGWSIQLRTDVGLPLLNRFVMMPLFLFSGTFFPVSQLPAAVRPVAYAMPLWHGVDLARGLALGTARASSVLLHVGYLALFAGAGIAYGCRTYRRMLDV